MSLIMKLAGRNIFRNIRRTVLTVMLISFGLAALLFADGFIKGMMKTLTIISTETYLGHAQVHKKGYRGSNDVDDYIQNIAELEKTLLADSDVKSFSVRTISGAMLSSSENISSVSLIGVNAEQEASVSAIKAAMIEGSYLSGSASPNSTSSASSESDSSSSKNDTEIIIGYDLADLLGVGLGDRIVVTVSAAHGGELSQELFRVSGLFKFNDRSMDKGMAFINLEKSQKLLNISGAHEVVLKFQDLSMADDNSLPIWTSIKDNEIEILDWKKLVPQLSSLLELSSFSTLIISIIMFSLVALGLINSMFMSIYERHQEFGVLLALGTRPSQIFFQIMSEGFLLGVISAFIGLILGGAISYWYSIVGIDYGNMEMSGLTISQPIYSIIEPLAFIELSIAVLVITTLACVYPALHAAKLSPSFAMRKVA